MNQLDPAVGTTPKIGLSLVVPILNEAETIGPFLDRVVPIVDDLMRRHSKALTYEIIFVDDGSSDESVRRLLRYRDGNSAIKIVSLSRNFGKDTALTAGLEHVSGAAVIPLDVDLQDPPEAIPDLYAKWLEGYDVVYGTRTDRSADSVSKRMTAGLFYRLYNKIAETHIPENAGDFRLLDRQVVEALRKLPERNRFMKGLYAWVGFRQTSVPIVRGARVAGVSKWRYWRLWNFALDGITSFSTMPLRIWGYVGAGIAALSFMYAIFLIAHTFVSGISVPGYASLMVAVLFMGGINLMTLGILGEYLGRTYTEVKSRPLYLVRARVGFDEMDSTTATKDEQWTPQSTIAWRPTRTGTGGS
jgi:polyisoprenyl-phosphate glycosyltransferase